jgi:hypothetical protein
MLEEQDRIAIVNAIRDGFVAARQGSTGTGSNRSSSSNNFGKAASRALDETATTFDRLVNQAGGRVSQHSASLVNAIPLLNNLSGAVGGTIGYLEDTHATFQALSKVGAGANGSLSELRLGAAETRMTLESFANMVGSSSQQLSGFEGGVQGGVKRFRELSNAMFSGDNPVIENFQRLGYTLEESNEFIIKNMEFQRRQARFQGPDGDEAMLAASLRMAESLDVMAKLSGKQLKEMEDELIDRQRNGATQARIRLLEQQGVEGAGEAYQRAQASLQSAPKVARDLLDDLVQTGAPMTAATKNFAATNKQAYAALVEQANAIKRGDAEGAARRGAAATAAAAEYANSTQGLTLATMAQISDVAQGQATVLEETGGLIDQIAANQRRMAEETGRTPTYLEALNNALANIRTDQGAQAAGTVPGQEAGVALQRAQLGLAETSSKLNTQIADQMRNSNTLMGKLNEFLEALTKTVNGAAAVGTTAANAAGGTGTSANNSNFLRQDRTLFEQFSNPDTPAEERARLREELGQLITEEGLPNQDAIAEKLRRLEAGTFTNNKQIFDRAAGGSFRAGDMLRVGERGVETMIAGFDGAVIPNMKNMLNRMPDMAKQLQDDMAMTGVPMSEAARSAMANMGTDDIGVLVQHAQTTNELLARLLGVNNTQVRVGEKQLRSVRGAGNLMNGIGRA